MTQSVTHWTITAVLRPYADYCQLMTHRAISTGISKSTIAYHGDVDATEWLLCANEVAYTGRGMTQGEGRVHSEAGRLVATYAVQGMIWPLLSQSATSRMVL